MKFLLVAMIVSGTAAAATMKQYDLKINYALNGKPITGSHVIVKPGETATVINGRGGEETFMDVTAVEESDFGTGMKVKFVLGKIENGERKILSTPEIMTDENGKGTIISGEMETEDRMSLSVLAKEKAL